jgi:hypothetical protein
VNKENASKLWKMIQEALDTLVIFKSDSVISVYEDLDLHYKHNKKGLKKI